MKHAQQNNLLHECVQSEWRCLCSEHIAHHSIYKKKKKSKLEYLTVLPWECHLRVMKGRVQVKYLWLQEPILPKVFQEISCVNVFTDSESPKMKSSYRTQGPARPEAADTSVQSPFFARLNIIFYGAVVGHLFQSLTFGPTCAIKYELNWNAHILINMCNTERPCSSSNALLLKHLCCTPSTSHCTICIAWGSQPPDSRPLWCRPAAGSNPLIPPLIAVNHKRTSCCSVFSLPAFLSQFNLDIDILDKKKKLSGLQIARGMLLAGEWKSPSWVN